jgi:hypothetical protein
MIVSFWLLFDFRLVDNGVHGGYHKLVLGQYAGEQETAVSTSISIVLWAGTAVRFTH